jgi:hypothetical protein
MPDEENEFLRVNCGWRTQEKHGENRAGNEAFSSHRELLFYKGYRI